MFDLNGNTSTRRILRVFQFFRENPEGRIATGDWVIDGRGGNCAGWGLAEFRAWFRDCLNRKINREDTRRWRCLSDEYQANLLHDAREIRRYYIERIRHTGCCGLLRTKEMQKRYPRINCQPRED